MPRRACGACGTGLLRYKTCARCMAHWLRGKNDTGSIALRWALAAWGKTSNALRSALAYPLPSRAPTRALSALGVRSASVIGALQFVKD